MAAIIYPDITPAPRPHGHRPLTPPAASRSHLRVIEGGRSPRSMAKVYRRRRILAVVVLALVLMTGAVVLHAGLSALSSWAGPGQGATGVASTSAGPGERVVIVQPGDTFTSIARELRPNGDVRDLVSRLSRSHGSGTLMAGDRLVVPVD